MPSNVQLKLDMARLKQDLSAKDVVIADLEKQVADLTQLLEAKPEVEVEVVYSDKQPLLTESQSQSQTQIPTPNPKKRWGFF